MFGTTIFRLGACLAGLGVVIGAFGAHAVEGMVTPERLATFETGVQYHMYHALALLILGWVARDNPSHYRLIGYCFLGGILLFSGSLYTLVLTDTGWLGAITPIGGLAFIAGWILLAWRGLKPPVKS